MFKNILFVTFFSLIISFPILGQKNDELIWSLQEKLEVSAPEAILLIEKELLNTEHNNETLLGLEVVFAQAFRAKGDYMTSKKLSEKTLESAKTLKLKYEEGRAIYALGIVDSHFDDYLNALNKFEKAKAIFSELNDYKMHGYSLLALGSIYKQSGDLPAALEYYKQALVPMRLRENLYGIGSIYSSIGSVYFDLDNYEKANYYYSSCVSEATQVDDFSNITSCSANIAHVYIKLNDYEKAEIYANKAINVSKKYGFKKSKIYALLILGEIESYKNNVEKAEVIFKQTLNLSRGIGSEKDEIKALLGLAKLRLEKDGVTFAQLAYDKSKKIKRKDFIRESSELMANYYFSINNYKQAYEFLKIYQTVNAQIIRNDNNNSISSLTNSLASSKANYEIEILKKNELLNKAYIEEQKYSQAIWLLVIIIISIVLFTSYRRFIINKQTLMLKMQVDERTKDIQRIGEFGKKITSLIEIEQVAEESYEQVKILFNADVFGLGIYHSDDEFITFAHTFEKNKLLAKYQVPVSDVDRLAVICVCQKRQLNIANRNEHLKYVKRIVKPLTGSLMESVVYLPLFIESRVVGCITVQKEISGGFTDSEMNILRSISSYISVAVVNSMTLSNVKTIAYTDYLTELPNRRAFIERYNDIVVLNNRSENDLCVAIADIDKFKLFNDKYGHDGGDYVLKEVAKLFKKGIRSQDLVARWGGEEFVFVFPNTKLSGAIVLLNKIRARLAETVYTFDDRKFSITSTFGVVDFDQEATLDEMIDKADQALYIGKSKGRNQVVNYQYN